MATERKPFDVAVFGATGFTGRLVVEYFLADQETAVGREASLAWAIAARNADKIDETKRAIKKKLEKNGQDTSVVDQVPVIVADGTDRDAVLKLVQSTRVVLSCAGPYEIYSALMVELCVEHGVHYCDLSAEMPWAKANVEKYEAKAKQTGARIVHCCGFEAVPSDLMTFLLADLVDNELNAKLSRVNYFWKSSMGGASGGTVISLLTMLDDLTPNEKRAMTTPYYFTSPEYGELHKKLVGANTSTKKLPYDPVLKARSALFLTGMIDQQVVLRSNYLMEDKYGDKFVYIERMSLKTAMNWLITLAMASFAALATRRWTRKLLWKLAPKSGKGPSENTMKRGYFSAEAHAYSDDGKLAAQGECSGIGDPGYLITSKLISEVAICLAKGEQDGALTGGGFLTPATACGHSLASRLNEKKIIDLHVRRAKKSA